MTPEREKYLASCSLAEQVLREEIRYHKWKIKVHKRSLTNSEFLHGKKGREYHQVTYRWIKENKIRLSAVRHYLNHLKGMDRVVVPICSFCLDVEEGNIVDYEVCYCRKCGALVGGDLSERCDYCPKCGRKILWEKVK